MSASLNDRLEAYFRERPDQWIDGKALAAVAGYAGYRNRITDLRLKRHMDIENLETTVHQDGCAKLRAHWRRCNCESYRKSEYRFHPAVSPESEPSNEAHDLNSWSLR